MKAYRFPLALVLAVSLIVPAHAAVVSQQLSAVNDASRSAARTHDAYQSYEVASAEFDGRGHTPVLSTPVIAKPPEGTLKGKPTADLDLVVGDTEKGEKTKEPPNPLDKDNKPKTVSSGKGVWWALGGAAAGAGLGFLLGGPVGAAVGGLLGALAGFFLGP